MQIYETRLNFYSLSEREDTTTIVVHHSNGGCDVDFSAERIHQMHCDIGYSGIGYHYVIRKNGNIERGRPEYATGAHAQGHNYYSIGICLSGDFEIAQPTQAQLNSLAELIADICRGYNLPIDRNTVVGHLELNETGCPGQNLYSRLNEVVERARAVTSY